MSALYEHVTGKPYPKSGAKNIKAAKAELDRYVVYQKACEIDLTEKRKKPVIVTEVYAKAMQRYNIEIEEYEKSEAAYREHEKSYQAEMESYDERVAAYKSRCTKTIDEIFRVRNELEYALITFYHQNIIYPKYRNFVAVTTIYEYLASGRCDTLEGADGAYNLYEMELRQNIIIGQLSSVLDSLEQIKNNQFTLYKEITEANQKSADLLSDISNNTKFSAYANKEIAKVNRIIAQNTEATKYYTLFNAAKRK